MKKQKDLSDNTGRSALEMAGVLVIIAILTVGGIAGYSKAMPQYRMYKLADQAAMIITNIRAAFSIKDNYAGLTTTAGIQMGAISKESVKDGAAYTVYGGHVFLAPSEDNHSVFITFSGLPKNACVYLATADWAGQLGSGIKSIATLVQETQAPVSSRPENNIGTEEDKTIPLTPVVAGAGCSDSGFNNAVVIEYK